MKKLFLLSVVGVAAVAWGQVFRPNGFTSAASPLTYSTAHSSMFDAGLSCGESANVDDMATAQCQARLVSSGVDSEQSNVFTTAENQDGTGHRLVAVWVESAYFQPDGGNTTNYGHTVSICWFWRPYANGDAGSGHPWSFVSSGYGTLLAQNTHRAMYPIIYDGALPLPPGYHCFVPAMDTLGDAGHVSMRINRLYEPFNVAR